MQPSFGANGADCHNDVAMPAGAPTTIGSIQILRGLAAVATVIGHSYMAVPGTVAGQSLLTQLLPCTLPLRAAVDLFFMISGFVMMAQISRPQPPTWPTFLARRVLRIYPLYWLSTLLLVPALFAGSGLGLRGDGTQPSLLLSLTLLPQDGVPLLAQAWSLVHEMVFYVVVALILATGTTRHARAILATIGLVAVIQSAMGGALAHTHLFSVHMVEFLAGMTAWQLYGRLAPRVALLCGGLGCTSLTAIGIAVADQPSYPLDAPERIVLYGLPAFLLLLCALGLNQVRLPIRIARLARLLGDTSYSIYLFHVGPLVAMAFATRHLSLGPAAILTFAGMAVFLAITFGVLIGRVVELPLQRFLTERLARSAPRKQALRPSAPAE